MAKSTESEVYWITGASSGIGAACAKLLAAQGHKIILSSRREKALQKVKMDAVEAGASASNLCVLPLDICDYEVMPDVVLQAQRAFGRIDVLFNNAGVSQRSLFVNTELETYRKLFEVDVFGQIALTKLVVPIMLQQGRGQLAVTASVTGKVGVPLRSGYCAAKHAVMGFFDSLRTELEGQGITVSTVVPGFIQTDVAKNALKGDGARFAREDTAIRSGMAVGKAAGVIVKGLQKGKKEISVGEGMEMKILWIKRLLPWLAFRILRKMAQELR